MEWKIGEIKQVNGEWYQCVVAIQGCRECSFRTQDYCTRHFECLSELRRDKTSVVFKKLEKVGEPILYGLRLTQRYKVSIPVEMPKDPSAPCISYNFIDKLLYIEIKQTKEDMEESNNAKHSNSEKVGKNLKPFSLEAAKSGKPVCTRDGRKARIIAVGLNNKTYPLAAVIENNGEENEVHNYTSDGLATYGTLNDADLMMFPEKKGGWVNVYKECDGERVERFVYKTEKEAFDNAEPDNYIATVKIEWEE